MEDVINIGIKINIVDNKCSIYIELGVPTEEEVMPREEYVEETEDEELRLCGTEEMETVSDSEETLSADTSLFSTPFVKTELPIFPTPKKLQIHSVYDKLKPRKLSFSELEEPEMETHMDVK